MQPLISPIDHESRHNSHRNEDIQEARVAEDTPLLYRFPAVQSSQRNPTTTIVVTLLLVILLSGVVIGVYLLVLQSRSENVLPPVEMPLQLVRRAQWDRSPLGSLSPFAMSSRKAKEVIVVHTGSRQCFSSSSCTELLKDMKSNGTSEEPLPYNFLVSSNGQTYEGLGWRRRSPLFPEHSSLALVLAFIGNFTSSTPPHQQVEEAKNLITESVSRRYLEPSYVVFGRNTNSSPKALWSTMEQLPRWSKEMSEQ